MVLPGSCIGDLIENVDFLAANERAIHRIAQASVGITSIVGFIDYNLHQQNDNGTVRKCNAAAVMRDGVVLQRARKSLLPNYRYFDDRRFFTPGETRQGRHPHRLGRDADRRLDLRGHVGRLFYEIKPLPELAAKGASVLLNLNASPFYPGKRHERDALIRRHLAQVNKPLVYVNTVGAADNGKNVIAFDGESLVYDGHGRLIAIGPQFEEQLLVVDLGEDAVRHADVELPPIDREREVYDALVMGLRDYMRKSHFTDTVVPVSGGIRLGAGPRDRRKRCRARARARLQPALAIQRDTTRSIAEA